VQTSWRQQGSSDLWSWRRAPRTWTSALGYEHGWVAANPAYKFPVTTVCDPMAQGKDFFESPNRAHDLIPLGVCQCCDEQNINHARPTPCSKIHNPSPCARIDGARLRRGWMRRLVSPSVPRNLWSRVQAQMDCIVLIDAFHAESGRHRRRKIVGIVGTAAKRAPRPACSRL
jgi:hypothetical protein